MSAIELVTVYLKALAIILIVGGSGGLILVAIVHAPRWVLVSSAALFGLPAIFTFIVWARQ